MEWKGKISMLIAVLQSDSDGSISALQFSAVIPSSCILQILGNCSFVNYVGGGKKKLGLGSRSK
jgi:hypothetical protein